MTGRARLTDALAFAARPREREYAIHDADSIQQAPLRAFERDAPVIECTVGDRVAAVVAIDRSDAKITVRRVQLSACTVHAEWDRALAIH